jgi:hypothetical protein
MEVSGHVCGIFEDLDEQFQTICSYVKDAFERNERALHIIDPQRRESHLARLRGAGIDVDGTVASGQFLITDWNEVFFDTGLSDDMEIIEKFRQLCADGHEKGFKRTRFFTETEYQKRIRTAEGILRYEALFQKYAFLTPQEIDVTICSYLIPEWSGDVLMDLMRTHQFVILRGHLHENPFYERPDEVLETMKTAQKCC